MSVLVTGCSSCLGYHLLNLLANKEGEITAVSAELPAERLRLSQVKYVTLDPLDYRQTLAILSETKPSEIYHLASQEFSLAMTGLKTSSLLQSLILGTHHLLEAIRHTVPKSRIVFVSSAEVYGSGKGVVDVIHRESDPILPFTAYATAVGSCELMIRQYQLAYQMDAVTARAFAVTGPFQARKFVLPSVAGQIVQVDLYDGETVIYTGNLDVSRDYLDVRDQARGIALLMKRGERCEVYNVCSGKARTIRDLVQFLIGLSKCPIEIRIDPGLERAIDIPLLVGSPEKLTNLTGWKPIISLEDSLRDLYSEMRDRVNLESIPN